MVFFFLALFLRYSSTSSIVTGLWRSSCAGFCWTDFGALAALIFSLRCVGDSGFLFALAGTLTPLIFGASWLLVTVSNGGAGACCTFGTDGVGSCCGFIGEFGSIKNIPSLCSILAQAIYSFRATKILPEGSIFWLKINYLMILVTTPEPTVRPPSRIAKRSLLFIAIGA